MDSKVCDMEASQVTVSRTWTGEGVSEEGSSSAETPDQRAYEVCLTHTSAPSKRGKMSPLLGPPRPIGYLYFVKYVSFLFLGPHDYRTGPVPSNPL